MNHLNEYNDMTQKLGRPRLPLGPDDTPTYSKNEVKKLLNDYTSHVITAYMRREEHIPIDKWLENPPRDPINNPANNLIDPRDEYFGLKRSK
jgi:hypothetical protein